MGREQGEEEGSGFPWWRDFDSHILTTRSQSQWLQTTLSDLDNKTKAMLNIIQDEGDTFAIRAEMYYQRRPELIQMVEDLQKSYRSLTEKHAHLRSEINDQVQSFDGPHISQNGKLEAEQDQDLEAETESCEINIESGNKPHDGDEDKRGGAELINGKNTRRSNDFEAARLERGMLWNELKLKVAGLVEDNLQSQTELIRRNDEKRETITDLCSKVNELMNENMALKNDLEKYKKKRSRFRFSRALKGLFAKSRK